MAARATFFGCVRAPAPRDEGHDEGHDEAHDDKPTRTRTRTRVPPLHLPSDDALGTKREPPWCMSWSPPSALFMIVTAPLVSLGEYAAAGTTMDGGAGCSGARIKA